MDIHNDILKKLQFFIDTKKIPHIIFHGPNGNGKHTILHKFIDMIYCNNKEHIKEYVMYVNCAHGKGIRFIRDELKFFAKTNIQNHNGLLFKSIVLFNACKLTTDAQSALRRCIEQFSHTTRFFIVVQNTNQLLKPILSRFCNIFIPLPIINKKRISLHKYKNSIKDIPYFTKKNNWLKKTILDKKSYSSNIKSFEMSELLYNKGYSALDIINVINTTNNDKLFNNKEKYKYLIFFDKIRKEFRNEKLLMSLLLHFILMRKKLNLENILTM